MSPIIIALKSVQAGVIVTNRTSSRNSIRTKKSGLLGMLLSCNMCVNSELHLRVQTYNIHVQDLPVLIELSRRQFCNLSVMYHISVTGTYERKPKYLRQISASRSLDGGLIKRILSENDQPPGMILRILRILHIRILHICSARLTDSTNVCVRACVRVCVRACVRACVYSTYVLTCMHSCVRACVRAFCVRACVREYMHGMCRLDCI